MAELGQEDVAPIMGIFKASILAMNIHVNNFGIYFALNSNNWYW